MPYGWLLSCLNTARHVVGLLAVLIFVFVWHSYLWHCLSVVVTQVISCYESDRCVFVFIYVQKLSFVSVVVRMAYSIDIVTAKLGHPILFVQEEIPINQVACTMLCGQLCLVQPSLRNFVWCLGWSHHLHLHFGLKWLLGIARSAGKFLNVCLDKYALFGLGFLEFAVGWLLGGWVIGFKCGLVVCL